ncbi:hypothetical protein Dimus_033752 [Dionaea muscipula]
MAETMDEAGFWLPSHFLTDDDFNDDASTAGNRLGSCFRTVGGGRRTAYGSSVSAIDSPVSSTETESDQDEFLADLTQQLARSSLFDASHTTMNLQPSPQTFARYASEKPWVQQMATSPQSTLSGFVSWANRSGNVSPNSLSSQVPSPPSTPPDELDLFYEAAGQVARLKMRASAQAQLSQQKSGLLGPPRNPTFQSSAFAVPKTANTIGRLQSHPAASYHSFPPTNQYHQVGHEIKRLHQQQQQQVLEHYCNVQQQQRQQMLNRGSCGGGCCGGGETHIASGTGGALGLPPSAWPPLRTAQQQQKQQHGQSQQHLLPSVQHQQIGGGSAMRAVFLGGSGAGIKRKSPGTGVFLPRRYGSPPTEPRKKPGCSTVLLPARVVQALNLNLEEAKSHHHPLPHQTLLLSEHDVIMARRKAAAAVWAQQQRRSMMRAEAALNHNEFLLPQEWTY